MAENGGRARKGGDMMITVNGKAFRLETPVYLAEILNAGEYSFDRIAVERNGSIVARADYGTVLLEAGDKVEIVTFVGGG